METRQERFVKARALREKYAAIGMPGTARLIDFLGSKHAEGLTEFGSSSIGPSSNGRFYVGRPHAEPPVSPLDDMEHNFEIIKDFSEENRKMIDSVLGVIGDSMQRMKKLRNRIPSVFRHWVISVFHKFGWRVSDEMSFGSKW